jgi:hypothetical protein
VNEEGEVTICMTHATNQGNINHLYFQEILKHIDYDKWMQGIVEMVRHVQKNRFDAEASFLYETIFAIRKPLMKRNQLHLYWKCYDWTKKI